VSSILNPYRHLAKMLRATMKFEIELPANDREKTMWMATVQFAGTQILLGRGGANTVFYTFGEGKRKYNYPAKVLAMLDKLAAQEFPIYRLRDSDNEIDEQSFFLRRLLAMEPRHKEIITGVDVDGVEKRMVAKARRDVNGNLSWIKVK
jgi:hypothetical protein